MQLQYRIRELRQNNGLTLKEVSEITDLSVSYLSDIERGRTVPSLSTLTKLSEAFEINLTDLLAGVDFAGEKTEAGLPNGLSDLLQDEMFGEELDQEWIRLLSNIQLRGIRPQTKREWLELYLNLKRILNEE